MIVITAPGAPGTTGPGYLLAYTCSGFSLNAGDIMYAQLIDHASGIAMVICAAVMTGLSQPPVVWGFSSGGTPFGRPSGHYNHYAQGNSIDVYLQWTRSNLTIVDSLTSIGWSWDSLSEAWYLAALASFLSNPQTLTPQLTSTYHNSP